MAGELSLRKEVVQILRCFDAQPVENVRRVGCPDVECISGWIEIKKTAEWPARPETVVRLDHDLSQEQRMWLRRRIRTGGLAWVLLQVDRDFLFYDGSVAAAVFGLLTKEGMVRAAMHTCVGLSQLREKLPQWIRPTKQAQTS